MDVTLALLADAANISKEGKLNLLGIFNIIHTNAFPAIHPKMQLVLSFEATHAEVGRQKNVEIVLYDADDNKLGSITGKFPIPRGESGYPIQLNQILNIPPLRFEKPGDYAFHILIGGEDKKSILLRVVASTPAKSKGD